VHPCQQEGRLVSTVSRTISYRHTAGRHVGHTGSANLHYRGGHSVEIDFGSEGEPWLIWRDILARRADGSSRCHIDGRVAYGGASCDVEGLWLYLTLSGLKGTVTLRFSAAVVDVFLRDAARVVAYGQERIEMDAELASLLGGTR
jgi:hypothetical protein